MALGTPAGEVGKEPFAFLAPDDLRAAKHGQLGEVAGDAAPFPGRRPWVESNWNDRSIPKENAADHRPILEHSIIDAGIGRP